MTVRDRLVAIGGEYTNKVEELVEQKWTKIKPVPSSTKRIRAFSTIVNNNKIYIFGRLI